MWDDILWDGGLWDSPAFPAVAPVSGVLALTLTVEEGASVTLTVERHEPRVEVEGDYGVRVELTLV